VVDSKSQSAPKFRRRKEARSAEIVDAAMSLFAIRGFAATTMAQIAARAGISKPTIYLYFKTKEDLFDAAILDRVTSVMDRAAEMVAADLPVRDAFGRVLRLIYAELIATDASVVLRVIVAEGERSPRLRERYEALAVGRGRAILAALIARGRASGELRDAPYVELPELLLAPALTLAVFGGTVEPFRSADHARFLEAHVDLVLNGILSATASG
jgi:AcrR family transcriptional regulator